MLAPGTTLVLAPDVSILARGPVLARGDPAHPIRLQPARAGAPWGTLALQGPGASGSRFAHVEIEEGGGARRGGVEYTGMVSLHHVRDVRFEHCLFARNLRSDDALHAVHSELQILSSRFEQANTDAVDFDYSSGRIQGSSFHRSGNDAIDLMSSSPWIEENRIQGAGDKGVSVGEASAPVLLQNQIEACSIGIEVKDRSAPWLAWNELAHNGIDVAEKAKNWRYGGGGFGRWLAPRQAAAPSLRLDRRSRWLTWQGDAPPAWLAGRTLAELRFEPKLGPAPVGWSSVQLPRGPILRDGDLVLRWGRQAASASRELGWSIPAGAHHVLLLEVAGSGLRQATLAAQLDSDIRTVSLPTASPDRLYQLVELPLSAGRLERLVVTALPDTGPRVPELRIHSLRVVEMAGPKGGSTP